MIAENKKVKQQHIKWRCILYCIVSFIDQAHFVLLINCFAHFYYKITFGCITIKILLVLYLQLHPKIFEIVF